ncbi:PLP-dependent aminotransferase family protein [Thermostichus vulcanus]|uniref:PLP-dependent aminotransferase family protein n=1 Tax=Thermostichus vulcanus str. 'Rupite' TaxID=2813851 RepID=A0ABT0CA17_THEVL|nr:PLP-dependent aminotransferase family protein [Thermostichus vulcanus]MCJ2542630.1 PLP-dependent aminotransferase family protein [Thermostichus vulcanus str. 'Rupite']
MTQTPIRPQLHSLFTERAQTLIPPPFGAEIPGAVPVVTSFAFGLADPTLFPKAELAQATAEVLAEDGDDALNYGGTFAGLIDLVLQLMQARGVKAEPENLLISYGSGQILGLLPQVFVEPGDVVIVEGPTFMGAVSRFAAAGARLISIPVDGEGMVVAHLEQVLQNLAQQGIRPRFIYTIPTFQNPKGSTLSLSRRQKLVQLAADYGVVVVEDDAYYDLRFAGDPLPTLASMDREGWVLYVGTFSKIVVPGVRVGWACGHPEIIQRLEMFRSEGSLGPFLGRVVARYCAEGRLQGHIQLLIQRYREKCQLMLDTLAQAFPADVRVEAPGGGFFVWCELPPDLKATELLKATRALGVTFLPGTRCFADGQGDNALRLAFSYQPDERIVTGIQTLGERMHALRNRH